MLEPEVVEARVVVLIGDDLPAARRVLHALPDTTGLPIVVAMRDGTAADFSSATKMRVIDASGSMRLESDSVIVAPARDEIAILNEEVVVHPALGRGRLDRMLRTLADNVGRDAIVVVLGGRDGDGGLGIKRIREAGGVTICQIPEEGISGDLPRTAIGTGVVDLVLAIDDIVPRLLDIASGKALAAANEAATRADDTLREILTMIRVRTGHDFSWYKRATLMRRLARRMQVCQVDSLTEYQRLLREQPTELGNLLRDFLISVTNFFRDPEAFAALEAQVIPRLFHGKQGRDQVRVWVAGCATGEEAYTIGMLLCEHAGLMADPPHLQVFATDIDDEALQEARAGVYPDQIETDVSPERLAKFFARENGGYRVAKSLREIVLFSSHNVLRDPPFSRLDLVTCRNLLIYLNREAQDRVLSTFQFALRPDGLLFLGSSESAEGANQFNAIDAKARIFERKLSAIVSVSDRVLPGTQWQPMRPAFAPRAGERIIATSFGELHHRAVELYAPPSVLIDDDLEVVHVSENAGKFLTIAGGEPTRQLLRLVEPELRFELRGAIYTARQPERGRDTRVVRWEHEGKQRAVEIRVRVVDLPEAGRGTLLVMFDELDVPVEASAAGPHNQQIEPVVREMEEELHRTRDQLRATIEQYETSLEELKASNEELHAINEELRSTTEELETSKEELQSVNEELTTLNHELKIKVEEISRANSDLQNLMTSTDIGVLFLDRNLNIKRFTPRIHELFNIIPSDIGRPLAHVTHRLDYGDLSKSAAQVLVDLRTSERKVASVDGKRFLARMLPYRSLEDRIEGVVLTFVDITDLHAAEDARSRTEQALRTSEERLAIALAAAPLAVLCHDNSLAPTWVFVNGKLLDDHARAAMQIFSGGDAERYKQVVTAVYESGNAQRIELAITTGRTPRIYDFRVEPARAGHVITGVNAVGFDITPSKQAEAALRENDRRKDEFLAVLSHELRNPLTPLRVAFDVAKLAHADPAQLAAALQIMDRQLQIVVRLVDDLLDLSRIAQGKIQLVPARLDIVRIIEAALETARPAIDEHHHTIEVALPDRPAVVVGDFQRLTQALTNLLMNAAKYTPDHGALSVAATAVDGHATIQVRDNGVGIPAEVLPRVFDMFVQARESEDRRDGGLGIGLNLVRRLVELHGGSVRAQSDGNGRGTTFVIELPLAPQET